MELKWQHLFFLLLLAVVLPLLILHLSTSEFDFYLDDLNPKALIVMQDSKSPVIEVAKIKKI